MCLYFGLAVFGGVLFRLGSRYFWYPSLGEIDLFLMGVGVVFLVLSVLFLRKYLSESTSKE